MNRDCQAYTGITIRACGDPATMILLWGCWRCDSYVEKFFCREHGDLYRDRNDLDTCGKCETKTGEYLEGHL